MLVTLRQACYNNWCPVGARITRMALAVPCGHPRDPIAGFEILGCYICINKSLRNHCQQRPVAHFHSKVQSFRVTTIGSIQFQLIIWHYDQWEGTAQGGRGKSIPFVSHTDCQITLRQLCDPIPAWDTLGSACSPILFPCCATYISSSNVESPLWGLPIIIVFCIFPHGWWSKIYLQLAPLLVPPSQMHLYGNCNRPRAVHRHWRVQRGTDWCELPLGATSVQDIHFPSAGHGISMRFIVKWSPRPDDQSVASLFIHCPLASAVQWRDGWRTDVPSCRGRSKDCKGL